MKTHIVNMKNKRSFSRPNTYYIKGFALYVDDLGFLSLDGKAVYIPRGGRKALQQIIAGGLDNPEYHFVYNY